MTDPSMADATYIEPITWQTVAQIIEKSAQMQYSLLWVDKLLLTAHLHLMKMAY